MSESLHLYDKGTLFVCTVKDGGVVVDVSEAEILFVFMKPDCTVVEVAGTLYTNGEDGKVVYATESSFLNMRGEWKYQVKVTISGSYWYSDTGTFMVEPNLN